MVSNCLYCDGDILFGNLAWLNRAYMGDFCSPACYKEYLELHPGFENRGKKGHCKTCGSDQIEITNTSESTANIGNILTGEKPVPHNIKHEHYTCNECHSKGEDWVILDKVENLEAYKENNPS